MRRGCRDSQPWQAAELPRQGSSDPSLGYGVRNPRGILRSHPWHPGFPRWIPYASIYSSCWKLLSADLLRVFQPKGRWVPGALWDPSRAARPSEGRLWTCSSPGRAGHCLDSRDSPAHTGMGTHGLGGGPWQVGGSAWQLSTPACPSRTLSTEALEEMTLKYIKFSLSRLSLWRPQPSHNARSQI